jgi:predicted RND superfamily exporter protein
MSYARWVAGIGRHYRAIVAASAVLSVASLLSLTRLRLDIDVLNMLPHGTPAFDDFKAFVSDFGRLDELLVLIDGAPPADLRRFVDALTPRLAALDTIADVHARIDTAQVLDGILGTYLFNYLPEDAYDELDEQLTAENIDRQVAIDRAILSAPFDLTSARAVADDPLGFRRLAGRHLAETYADAAPALDAGYFTARDGGALLVFVRPTGSAFDTPFIERLMSQVSGAVAATERELGGGAIRVRYTGSYLFALEDAATFKADIARYTVLALLGVLTIFYLGYGNLRVLPFVTYPLVVTTLVTFALSLLIYRQLNVLSISFAAILYGLSIDSGIYFYSRLLDERRRAGGDVQAAITATLVGLGRANIAATATTAGAFAVIGLSVLGVVRQLGVLTAIGMGVTALEFFTLYPALGFLLGSGRRAELRARRTERLAQWAERIRRRAWALRIAMLVAAAVFAAGAVRVSLDANLDKLRPADSPALRVQQEIEARFTPEGRNGAVLVRRSDPEQALVDGERVAALLHDYRARGLVRGVQTVDAVLPSEHAQRARLARYNDLPRAAAVERLRGSLERQGFKTERFDPFLTAFAAPRSAVIRLGDPALRPLGFAIDHHVRQRGDETIVAAYLDPATGADWPTVAAQLRRDLAGLPIAIAARPLLEYELGGVLRHELRLFLLLAFLGNFVLLVAIVRSVRIALAVLTPVALVVLGLFAGMWIAHVPIDPINLIIPPLIVGIGVDNGVYLAAAARQLGGIGAAVGAVGRAISITSLTTITGFGFLALSTYPPLATMGGLMAIALSLCLLGTFFLLPALLPQTAAAGEDGSPAGAPR